MYEMQSYKTKNKKQNNLEHKNVKRKIDKILSGPTFRSFIQKLRIFALLSADSYSQLKFKNSRLDKHFETNILE